MIEFLTNSKGQNGNGHFGGNSTQENAKARRSIGGVWGGGTFGFLVLTYFYALEMLKGLMDGSNPRSIFAWETADAIRATTVNLGPGHESVSLPAEMFRIIPARTNQELAGLALESKSTRRYGQKLNLVPETSTAAGVGGQPIVGLMACVADFPALDERIRTGLLAQRERHLVTQQSERGKSLEVHSVSHQFLVGNAAGGTFNGSAIIIASRIKYWCKQFGLPVKIHLIVLMPSVATTHDRDLASRNCAAFLRQASLACEKPERIRFHLFNGETISNEAGEPLFDSIVPWGVSSGKITLGNRQQAAADIALTLHTLLETPLAQVSEEQFRDGAKDLLDRRNGFRGFRRIVTSRFHLDQKRNDYAATLAGMETVTNRLLGIE